MGRLSEEHFSEAWDFSWNFMVSRNDIDYCYKCAYFLTAMGLPATRR